jgi:hypothetical protein
MAADDSIATLLGEPKGRTKALRLPRETPELCIDRTASRADLACDLELL